MDPQAAIPKKNLTELFATGIPTGLGAGFFPWAPGTMGSFVGVLISFFTSQSSLLTRILFWVLLTVTGTWAAKRFDQKNQSSDNQKIVIDEVIGVGIASWTVGADWKSGLVAFFLFRFFDILKPPPVRQIDKWSKNQTSPMLRAFGVLADDIVAGFQALSLVILYQWLNSRT